MTDIIKNNDQLRRNVWSNHLQQGAAAILFKWWEQRRQFEAKIMFYNASYEADFWSKILITFPKNMNPYAKPLCPKIWFTFFIFFFEDKSRKCIKNHKCFWKIAAVFNINLYFCCSTLLRYKSSVGFDFI